MRHATKQFGLVLGTALVACAASGTAHAGPGMIIEAVSDYSACNGPSLTNPITDATGFRDTMIFGGYNPAAYYARASFFNSLVWTSDFYDPQMTGQADDDHLYFDRPGNTFSYFAGHGACNINVGDTSGAYPPAQNCTTSGQCTNPPAGTQLPGFCRRYPGDGFGTCSYTKMGRKLLLGNCSSGPPNRFGIVDYSSGLVRWGESGFSGNWTGAGTNGGVNVVVLHSSCAEMSNRGQEVFPAFAGLHVLATVLLHRGDTNLVSNRGSSFAMQYHIDPNSSVAWSWAASMSSIGDPGTALSRCRSSTGVSYGGGYGVNGCGGHNATSMGATSFEASAKLSQSWNNMRTDATDGLGAGYWAAYTNCNYDCWNWPFALP